MPADLLPNSRSNLQHPPGTVTQSDGVLDKDICYCCEADKLAKFEKTTFGVNPTGPVENAEPGNPRVEEAGSTRAKGQEGYQSKEVLEKMDRVTF